MSSSILAKCAAALCILVSLTGKLAQAATVRYTLDVYYISGSPDGIHKDKILGINGQFPGPTLEANVGDTLEITLINSIQDGQNTTIHWHGISQKGSLFEDGTSQISQCPLPVGESQLYRFNVTAPGTFWYHSHVKSQYTEGMYGALLVHGQPEAYAYDGEFTVILGDWFHRTAHANEEWHLSARADGVPPYPDSALLNGMGRYPCPFANLQERSCDSNSQLRQVFRVQRDKTYRFRLISAASVAAFNVSIDDHTLHTIEADGIDVKTPVQADIVTVSAGQRYSFLVKCSNDTNNSRFLIRANLRKADLRLIPGGNINQYPEALMGDLTAIFECTDDDLRRFPKRVDVKSEVFDCYNVVPPQSIEGLTYLDEMKLAPLDGIPAPDYFDDEFVVNADFRKDIDGVRRASFNRTPFELPHDRPLLMKVLDGETLPRSAFALEINFGNVIQVVINNPFNGPHPFHLHGHHFWILGVGGLDDGDYDPEQHQLRTDGVKRDTVFVEEHSWAVIRFVADNPGVWTFHCHIDWHNLSGMSLVFVEAANMLRRDVIITDEAIRVCKMHLERNSAWNATIS